MSYEEAMESYTRHRPTFVEEEVWRKENFMGGDIIVYRLWDGIRRSTNSIDDARHLYKSLQ